MHRKCTFFLKTFMCKHVSSQLTWDEVAYHACAAYTNVPNEHSNVSAFFIVFGSNKYTLLIEMSNPKIKYMGDDSSLLALDALRDIIALE